MCYYQEQSKCLFPISTYELDCRRCSVTVSTGNVKTSICMFLSAALRCRVAAASSLYILSGVDRGHMGPSTQSGAHSLQLIQAANV